jgi:hypothetical protein
MLEQQRTLKPREGRGQEEQGWGRGEQNPPWSHSICGLGGAIIACWGQINVFNRHVYLTGFPTLNTQRETTESFSLVFQQKENPKRRGNEGAEKSCI